MKKFIQMLAASAIFGLAASPFMPATAASAGHFHSQTPATVAELKWSDCANLKNWYVNGDEKDRLPTPQIEGLEFDKSDLIHHAAEVALADLKPGEYKLVKDSDEPDQPSFFSVEVRASTGAYGTLRWNKDAGLWQIVIGAGTGPNGAATAGTFSGADPAALLSDKVTKWGKFDATAKVVTFGVGFTLNPPSLNVVHVKSVEFQGKTYPLTCPPPVMPTPSKSPVSPSASGGVYYETCDDAPHKLIKGVDPGYRPELDSDGDGIACEARGDKPDTLPVTGSKPYFIAATGAIALFLGIAIVVAFRRKGN